MYGCCFIICFQRFAWDLKVFEVTAPEVKMSLALTHTGAPMAGAPLTGAPMAGAPLTGAPMMAEMQR